MLVLVKALLFLGKSRRGRKLLFTAGLLAAEVARSEQARKLYAKARRATVGRR
jgi:hypothetical protein